MATSGAPSESSASGGIDAIIAKLLEVRGSRPGKQVNLTEAEIRDLCTSARDIFMNQPVLLELEAPIKICGARPRLLPGLRLPGPCGASAGARACALGLCRRWRSEGGGAARRPSASAAEPRRAPTLAAPPDRR